jgi:NitT/TauT family transport system ATP-binding protein
MKLNITKSFGDKLILDSMSMELSEGQITCLLGESGSGKTTVLNIISGFTDCQGTIEDKILPVSYIFQTDRLLPNLTVFQNIDYVLKSVITDKIERECNIIDILSSLELMDAKDKFPKQLSGGMSQRVSMARACSFPAKLLLMDEPFRELDIGIKSRLISAFRRLWEKNKPAVLYVTHDIEEALMLADNICILKGGKIVKNLTINGGSKRKLTSPEINDIREIIYKEFM